MIKHLLLLTVITFSTSVLAEAQLRESVNSAKDYSGAIVQSDRSADLERGVERPAFQMSHSYSMTFGSYGGQYQNLNAYTNHMFFDLSDRLTGQMDVSLMHSPFGGSYLTNGTSTGTRIMVQNARLDYELSPKSSITVQFSQNPYSYSPYGRYPGYYGNGLNQHWY